MARALGIGGAFFKHKLAHWYSDTLQPGDIGPPFMGSYGVVLQPSDLPSATYVQFSAVPHESPHLRSSFMFNFVVDEVSAVLERIESNGGEILRRNFEVEDVGAFAWFKDPEGNEVELWQPQEG